MQLPQGVFLSPAPPLWISVQAKCFMVRGGVKGFVWKMDSMEVGLRSAESVNQMFEPDRGVKWKIIGCQRSCWWEIRLICRGEMAKTSAVISHYLMVKKNKCSFGNQWKSRRRLHRNWSSKRCHSKHASSKMCWRCLLFEQRKVGSGPLYYCSEFIKPPTCKSMSMRYEYVVYYSTEHFILYSRATPQKSSNLSQDAPHQRPPSFHSPFLLFTGSSWGNHT